MSTYEIGILGVPDEGRLDQLRSMVADLVEPFGLTVSQDVAFLDETQTTRRDRKSAFVGVYFGAASRSEASDSLLQTLIREHLPIVPVVEHLGTFSAHIPDVLHFANGMELSRAGAGLEALAAVVLECLGLLRRQRRVFVSYRRGEAAQVALQLHEGLGEAGFDVFLDTYDVRPAEDFQAVLWHRLCDSDVVVMLDTPGYFASRWTAAELGRALAKQISVLGVVWPGHTPQRIAQLREPIFLANDDLLGVDGPLARPALQRIRETVERLRSRSLAIRHAAVAGAIASAVEGIGGSYAGVGTHRALSVILPDERRLRLFPTIGVPTAETFQEIEEQAGAVDAAIAGVPMVAYDHVGLHPRHQGHLDWLQEKLGGRRTIRVTQAGWELAGLGT